MKNTKKHLSRSALALFLCVTMFIGTTFAWFTDSVTSGGNIIKSGTLDLEMYWTDDLDGGVWYNVEDAAHNTVFSYDNWEPGYTDVRYIKLVNNGNLALNYSLTINPTGEVGKLAEVINVYFADSKVELKGRDDLSKLRAIGLLSGVLNGGATAEGTLLPEGQLNHLHPSKETIVTIAMNMIPTAGNEYQKEEAGDFSITALATQATYESDSFNNNYDAGAEYPTILLPDSASAIVNSQNGLVPAGGITLQGKNIKAFIPEGAKMENNSTKLSLSVKPLEDTTSGITAVNSEILIPVDIHVDGIAEDNTKPIIIDLGEILPKYMNMGNYHFYHVEDGTNKVMTLVDSKASLTAHNQFTYDPLTGEVSVAMATFSEVAMLADTAKGWEGEEDYDWYTEEAKAAKSFEIANADQLYAFAKIVGGMATNYENAYSFDGDTIKLLSDINLNHGTVLENTNGTTKTIFYPIGYYNNDDKANYDDKTNKDISSGFYIFEGTFDGNGHTVSNIYQNTWEMKGDHDWYAPEDQHYRDGMGLFGKVYGGTIKNLTVNNFKSDGEITTTGVIASYADGATFENIAITNCNPRVYNIGNGGIVGCVGWYAKEVGLKTSFKNITVDNSNKISALWGSYDVACGGIVGQYYPTSGQTSAGTPKNAGIDLVNCHVAAILDVNNDVCANYQYYWYRYSGMFIGSIRNNTTEGNYTVADTTGISANGCTYTLGTWNEYWYCELVKNSLASYTHDHQFSRLTKIDNLNEIKDDNGNWNQEGNFVIPAADNSSAKCYHIFKDSEGNLYQHFHDKADESNPNIYETFDLDGDGELNDLKEDRTCYFMPFNQLLNGNGYGVKAHYEFEGITEREDGPVASEKKFSPKDNAPTTYRPGQTIKLGNLVSADVDESKISKPSFFASVSPATEGDNVNATFSQDAGDWANSTITFAENCNGSAKIIITDYFYCTPTVITLNPEQAAEKFTAESIGDQNAYTEVPLGNIFKVKNGATIGSIIATVTDPSGKETTINGTSLDWDAQTISLTKDGDWTVAIKDDDKYCSVTTATFTVNKVDKFTKKFDKDFLYRVGNKNTVALGSIFEEIDTSVKLSSVTVDVENIAGNAKGTFTTNNDWTKGTLQFNDTGVVKVTISAEGANDLSLHLEVVDATNATTATSATNNNVVLLQDCGFGSLEVSGGYTLYGNGFTMTCGSDSYAIDRTYSFVELKGGTLDNVQIIVPNFSHALMYEKNKTENSNPSYTDSSGRTRYYNIRSAVLVSANSTITNSYISGGRAAIYTTSGTLNIKNSTVYGGAVANIQTEASCSLVLEDVTLIQEPIKANVNDTKKTIMGLSVVNMCDTNGNGATITLNGNLCQYAWANSDYKQYVPTDAQDVVDEVMNKTNYVHSITYADGVTRDSVNLGFVNMPDGLTATTQNNIIYDNFSLNSSYGWETVSKIANIYTYNNSNGTDDKVKSKPEYNANAQGIILPIVTYSDVNENREFSTTYDTTKHTWKSTLKVDVDAGDYTFSFDKLLAQKNGKTLEYTVKTEAGTTVDKNNTITLNSAISNVYILTITDNQIYNKDGISVGSTTHTYVFELLSTKTSLPAPTWTSKTLNGTPYIVVDSKGGDWNCAVPVLDGLKVKYWSKKQNKEIELDLANVVSAAGLSAGLQNGSNNTITITVADEYTLTVTTTGFKTNDNGKPVVVNGKLYFTVSSSSNYVSTNTTNRTVSISYSFTDANNSDPISLSTSFNVVYADYKSTQYKYSDFCNGTLTTASSGCVTADTLVTLADGSKKRIDKVSYSDKLLVWNFYEGKYDVAPAAIIFDHGADDNTVIKLSFKDGTEVKVVNMHQFYDANLKKLVTINSDTVDSYVGHKFAKRNGNKTKFVELESYSISNEYIEAWGVMSAGHYNIITEDMISADFDLKDVDLFNYFEIGEGMKFDQAKMKADIEKYGLYTYDDFAEYLTYEQFVAFNVQYFKIPVSKGLYTYEGIIELIDQYLK